jgi:hypothetical protein
MSKLNLDKYPNVRVLIVKEMQQVMQWWTQMRVRHTSTYGVRIYARDSMLINHVDRVDTHLASAVIQVDQEVDEDGGWPLEVLLGNRTVGEVYLQPGEMVLYEGAWLRHGRPMRFKGESFSNIFTHFAPFDWHVLVGTPPTPQRVSHTCFTGTNPVGATRSRICRGSAPPVPSTSSWIQSPRWRSKRRRRTTSSKLDLLAPVSLPSFPHEAFRSDSMFTDQQRLEFFDLL